MKRLLPLALALCLLLSACGSKGGTDKTPEELTVAYTEAINAARDEEMNGYFPVISDLDDELMELTLTVLGLTKEDVSAVGIAMSLANIRAYTVAAIMPAEGKEDTVRTGLEHYMETQQANFEFYLEEEYEIASNAKLEQLKDGTFLLVMSEDQDAIFDSVKSALEG